MDAEGYGVAVSMRGDRDRCSLRVLYRPGTRSVNHLRENLGALDVQLTPADISGLDANFPSSPYTVAA